MTRWLALALLFLFLPTSGFAADAVSISASASTKSPYQNQSILYTVRVIAHTGVSNVSLSDLRAANAIIEREGEPKVRQSDENGVPVVLVDFNFIITPLKAGSIVIPPVVLKGEIEAPDSVPSNPFGGSFMANMMRTMNAISSLAGDQSFSAASNATVLNIRPPVEGMDSWLPLASLKITEDASAPQSVRVGDLISRKITLSANGAVGSQLPDVEGQQNRGDFKVYADRPVMGQTIDKTGAILAWRTESFSLVPQHPGMLVLPAVTVSWWNVLTDKIATAELPQRTIKVLSGGAGRSGADGNVDLAQGRGISRGTESSKLPSGISSFGDYPWKILVAALVGGLLSITFLLLIWRRKFGFAWNNRGSVDPKAMLLFEKSRSVSTDLAALKHVREPEELKTFLQSYAHEHWGVAKNASLERIFATRRVSGSASEIGDIDTFVEGISAALYAGKLADIEDLKKQCRRAMTASKKRRTGRHRGNQQLASLNPD
jgi:hypothetical protein